MSFEPISISMTKSDLEELEFLLKEGEFSNRSDVVRHAVKTLLSEYRNIESAAGVITAVFSVLYHKKGRGHKISAVQHEFKDNITATIHSHTSDGSCVEVMIVTATAEIVRSFLKKLHAQKKVLKVIVSMIGGKSS